MVLKAMIEIAVPVNNLVDTIKETAIGTIIAKETLFVNLIVVLDLFQEKQTAVLIPESLYLRIRNSPNL